MTAIVDKQRRFHVNRTIGYSSYPLMVPGLAIDTTTSNPYFQYYETPVVRPLTLQDGRMVPVGAMKFLKSVRDGEINPHNLAKDAWEIAEHFQVFARELLFENVRLKSFDNAPSRTKALWLAEDLRELSFWRTRLGNEPNSQAQLVELEVTGKILRCDAAFLPADSEPMSASVVAAERYWSGAMSQAGAQPETLFEGTATVVRVIAPSELPS